jgi:hypothetical protein
MQADRLELATSLLQEAVYRSRANQAAGVALGGDLRLDQPVGPGACGLGQEAALELALGERGAELLRALWPAGGPARAAEPALRERLAEWVRTQDAFDRRRNHFLRDFRSVHGFDRRAWDPERARAYEEGLSKIHSELDLRRRAAAEALLELG